ncbi:class 3 lipase, putative [Trypanosoma brucei gambiense DAL972]|uniref:Class 3 lipase, putative n=1 Tax=Trypanosoma brucei gambiense (strain MHOM/CI/86/DAL972) TaxID=679716 RepID=D0A0U1_TRYB9|nr:class 3 lipase, putative [Trypanosoma brucei gambiense DAL972]CBH16849.1 class 3 lipase, putative [Trypanosoma brucei gambiense DAL972]|eukprot:XP_011779113.1 class 3 lipase, putative [Trypanosoma brucei gambiense DAL972]
MCTCTCCNKAIQYCCCRTCSRCSKPLNRLPRGRHCKRCWRSVCSACTTRCRYVNMLGPPEVVCDGCAVPHSIAFLNERKRGTPLWGLYVLWGATDAPAVCVTPSCGTYAYTTLCRACGLPTVSSRAHVTRSVHDTRKPSPQVTDELRFLDVREYHDREAVVNGYSSADVEETFRSCFPRGEDVAAFPHIGSACEVRNLLMSLVAAGLAYEYNRAPSLTLSLSDFPFACLLKLVRYNRHYTVLEAPGKVKFISFPGTHNPETVAVSLRLSHVKRQRWFFHKEGEAGASACASSTDVIGDCNSRPGLHQQVGGLPLHYRVHAGFIREAENLVPQMEEFVGEAIHRGYRLVFSGHSLGGAVATLVALQLLQTHPDLARDRVRCFTFGAPLVGDRQLTELVQRFGLTPNFHHIVHQLDIVPRLLCTYEWLRGCVDELAGRATLLFSSVKSWVGRFSSGEVDEGGHSEEADTIESRIRNGEGAANAESRVEVEDGDEPHSSASGPRYACFGNYHFLSDDGTKFFSTDNPEAAYQTLRGSGNEKAAVRSHRVFAYNRAIFLRVYTNGRST